MRAPALSVTTPHKEPLDGMSWTKTAHYGPRCAAKVRPHTPERRERSERARIAALFRRPRATQAEVDERQLVLELAAP